MHPGIEPIRYKREKQKKPMRILWAARWEHDKGPDVFFEAMKLLKEKNIDFRLNVIGETFREMPEIFNQAKSELADKIDIWGYQNSREKYEKALAASDIFVSTANHEFFGITALEAVSAGLYPLLPKRLSYPEVFHLEHNENKFFYEGNADSLVKKLELLSGKYYSDDTINGFRAELEHVVRGFEWQNRIEDFDSSLKNHMDM